MKKYIITLATALTVTALLTSCNHDSLDPESIIVADKVEYTKFDYWLEANFVNTHNISFKYRYEDIQSDFNYYTVPAVYENSIVLAHLVKYLCLEAYDEAGGIEFTRANFPKEIFCIGVGSLVLTSQAASTSSLCFRTSLFLRLISAVFTKIFLAQPSKEPSPR